MDTRRRAQRGWPRWPAWLLGIGALLLAPQPAFPAATAPAVVITIDGAIGPATAAYVERGLEDAAEAGAALAILRMDTPGGLADAMRDIIRAILASPVPVATYVAPEGARAASAGTYILYASHIAAMAPATNLGAATPVQMGGGPSPLPEEEGEGGGEEQPADAHAAKAINDSAAFIRSLAERRGRNVEWAEQAVREAASLSAEEAVDQHVADFIAQDVIDLLAKADGRTVEVNGAPTTLAVAGAEIVRLDPDWRERSLAILTDPNIAYILMLVGIYGIIFELANPGLVFSGVIGGIALLLGLFALNLLPIDYAGVGLLLLGVGLMTAEAFAPSFGILGLGGAVAFAVGSIMLFDTDIPAFEISLWVVGIVTVAMLLLLSVVLGFAIGSRRHRVVTGSEGLLGEAGDVLSWSGEKGFVHVHGERWQARASAELVPGERVRVIGREDLVLIVDPVKDPRQTS